jgi:AcrR family transcriptional regulator
VGQRFAQERNTFTNYGEARQSFYEDTISKHWVRFDDVVTRQILPEFEYRPGWTVKFEKDDVAALQEDMTAKSQRILEGVRAGTAKVADWRRMEGLPVTDADEVYLRPFNVFEVADGDSGAQRATTGLTAPSVREVSHNSQVQALPDPDTERRSRGLVPMQTRALIEQRAARVYTNAARRFGPVFYRYFQDQKDRVLAALNQRSASDLIERRDIADLIAIDWAAEGDELDPLIRQLWDLMGETATGQTVELLGLSDSALTWDVSNPWVRQVMSGVAERVTMVSETTKRDIARVVTDALQEGTSIPDLADKLRGLYEETYRGRSETIARSESQFSYNTAQVEASREGGVSEMELLDNPNHTTDPGSDGLTCAQRNGLIVPVDDVHRHIAAEHPNGTMACAPVVQLGVV